MQPDAETQQYFDSIQKEVERAYSLAKLARQQGRDPEKKVEIPLAEDLAARVEGLISTFFPELLGSGLAGAIRGLEEKYGKNDERVALLIGRETAAGKFAKFAGTEKSADAGLRVAVAYLTLGIVTAPLEGIASVRIKENDDRTKYLAVYYAGPIRSAGGTASALSVLAADFIRKGLGIDAYKPTEAEINRYYAEVEDYYNRVAAKQYHPTKEEISFIIRNVPVEITGDPTEELEVSNYKDLPRVETNKIRGGMCLVLLDGIPLKAEKILGRVKKYPKEYNLENWLWLSEFVSLKKKMHAEKKTELKDPPMQKYAPSNAYLSKVVAGRPIFSHPSMPGGFRLRYGRSRTGGLASTSIHPAAMYLTEFAAIGTQLATELPGKATVCTPCDSIEPPVVKLKQGSVVELNTEEEVLKYRQAVSAILSMGDILVPYGEFVSNNHMLLPAGYSEEWWLLEAKKAGADASKIPTLEESIKLSKTFGLPLHPKYNFFWHDISVNELKELIEWLSLADAGSERITLKKSDASGILDRLCAPYTASGASIILEGKSLAVYQCLGSPTPENLAAILSKVSDGRPIVENIFGISGIRVRERGPTRVGVRMGRPEKAEKRLLKGRPQILFPCGDEGGKMRNLMASYAGGKITAEFPVFKCTSCGEESPFSQCFGCGGRTEQLNVCTECGRRTAENMHCHRPTKKYCRRTINPKRIMDAVFKSLGMEELPKLFKGVRGVSGPERSLERLEKGVLRTQYDLYVNKDGTTRYDSTDVPLTHFKPKEIGVSLQKLRSLGYTEDMSGKPLESPEQVLELKVQDIIISDNDEFSSVDYLINVSRFVDELLMKFYNLPAFYNIKSKEDIIGQLVIGLAPHTSAGIVGRIIGFTPAKICLAHPFWHAGKRRNADGDEDSVMLLMDALLNFSRKFLPDTRGGRTMDSCLVLTSRLNPEEVDDEAWRVDISEEYPLELYEGASQFKYPGELSKKPKLVADVIKTPEVFHLKFTHDTDNIHSAPLRTKYVELKSMMDKVAAQLELAEKAVAVDKDKSAELIISKHFLRDIKGNLRTFSRQQLRCTNCTLKYRRPPLSGKCRCGSKLQLTVSEGAVRKYLEPTKHIVEKYRISPYLVQQLSLLERDVDELFGKKDRQLGLAKFNAGIRK